MGLITRTIAGGIAKSAGSRSRIYTALRFPQIESFVASALARFLPLDLGNAILELVATLHELFPVEYTLVELRAALLVMSILHAKRQKPAYHLSESTNRQLVATFHHYSRYATAAYGRSMFKPGTMVAATDREHIKRATGLDYKHIDLYVDSNAVRGRYMLEHFVATDHAMGSVVLAFKGTHGLEGIMKDLRSVYARVPVWGQNYDVHAGMWASARDLVGHSSTISQIKHRLEENPGYGLAIVGHSLGGGVAALVAIMLAAEQGPRDRFRTNSTTLPGRPIVCYGYGPVPPFDNDLAARSKDMILSLVNKNDIVPSLCHGAILDIKSIGLMLKETPEYYAKIIDGILTNTVNADQELQHLRNTADHMKLFPPGRVWIMSENDNKELKMQEVLDVRQRFREVTFAFGMITHHPLSSYIHSLENLGR